MALYLPALPPDAAQFVPLNQEKNKNKKQTSRLEGPKLQLRQKKTTSERAPNRMTWRLCTTVLIITGTFFQCIDAFS